MYQDIINKKINNMCRCFNYREKINRLLNTAIEIILEIILCKKKIVLYGSFVKGEPTLVEFNNKTEIFSDIDVFVLTESDEYDINTINKELGILVDSMEMENHLFHIGLKIRECGEIYSENKLFHLYEIQEYGLVLIDEIGVNDFVPINWIKLQAKSIEAIETSLAFGLLYFPKDIQTRINMYQVNYILMKRILDLLSISCVRGCKIPFRYMDRLNSFHKSQSGKTGEKGKKIFDIFKRSVYNKIYGNMNVDTIELYYELKCVLSQVENDLREQDIIRGFGNVRVLLEKYERMLTSTTMKNESELKKADKEIKEYFRERILDNPFETRDHSNLVKNYWVSNYGQ